MMIVVTDSQKGYKKETTTRKTGKSVAERVVERDQQGSGKMKKWHNKSEEGSGEAIMQNKGLRRPNASSLHAWKSSERLNSENTLDISRVLLPLDSPAAFLFFSTSTIVCRAVAAALREPLRERIIISSWFPSSSFLWKFSFVCCMFKTPKWLPSAVSVSLCHACLSLSRLFEGLFWQLRYQILTCFRVDDIFERLAGKVTSSNVMMKDTNNKLGGTSSSLSVCCVSCLMNSQFWRQSRCCNSWSNICSSFKRMPSSDLKLMTTRVVQCYLHVLWEWMRGTHSEIPFESSPNIVSHVLDKGITFRSVDSSWPLILLNKKAGIMFHVRWQPESSVKEKLPEKLRLSLLFLAIPLTLIACLQAL